MTRFHHNFKTSIIIWKKFYILSWYSKKGGIKTIILDRKVTLKTLIHLVTGDVYENIELCECFNSYGSIQYTFRDCKCSFEEI